MSQQVFDSVEIEDQPKGDEETKEESTADVALVEDEEFNKAMFFALKDLKAAQSHYLVEVAYGPNVDISELLSQPGTRVQSNRKDFYFYGVHFVMDMHLEPGSISYCAKYYKTMRPSDV